MLRSMSLLSFIGMTDLFLVVLTVNSAIRLFDTACVCLLVHAVSHVGQKTLFKCLLYNCKVFKYVLMM